MPVSLMSTIISGGFIAGILASRLFFVDTPIRGSNASSSETTEIIAEASKAQLPAQYAADELEAFIDRAALALQSQTPLREVLGYRSKLGAQVYAFYRSSPLGRRIWISELDKPDDRSPRPSSNNQENLTYQELIMWERLAQKGGGWCAYATVSNDLKFRPEYVYVKHPRIPAGPDIYISAGFSV